MTDDPTICRVCGRPYGSCLGQDPGCPVTTATIHPNIRMIIVIYAVVMVAVVGGILYLLWRTSAP